LDGAELVERILKFQRQKLRHDSGDGVERQPPACQLHLACRRHDVRLVAGVHHERFAVDVDDRLKQRWDEVHFIHRIAQAGPNDTTVGTLVRPVCRREPSWALGTTLRADFVDAYELDEFIPARLIRRHNALGPEVLQHPFVGVVGGANV